MTSGVLFCTLAATIVIGLRASRFVRGNAEQFFVAGRSLPAPLIAASLAAQAIDGNATMGVTHTASQFGFWAGAAVPIGLALSLVLMGGLCARRLCAGRRWTLVDVFEEHYGRPFGAAASVVLLLAFGIVLGGSIAAVSLVARDLFNVNYQSAVIVSTSIVLTYCVAGGIVADVYADYARLVFIGLVAAGAVVTLAAGATPSAREGWLSLSQWALVSNGALVNWATVFALALGNLLAVDFVSRVLAARSADDARRGCYVAAAITLLVGLPFAAMAGWVNTFPAGGVPATQPTLVLLASTAFSPVFAAIFISAVVAAALSTIDGAMLSMSNIVTRNILRIHLDARELSDRDRNATIIYFTRLSLLPVACGAMVFAMLLPAPGVLLTVAFDLMFAGLLVPLLAAFWAPRPSLSGAWAALLTGTTVRVLFMVLTPASFGVSNTLWYVPNGWFGPASDGLGTFLAPFSAAAAYVLMAHLESRQAPAAAEAASSGNG